MKIGWQLCCGLVLWFAAGMLWAKDCSTPGRVLLKTKPAEVKIVLNKQVIVSNGTPATTPLLCPGVYSLQISAPGYYTETVNIKVHADVLETKTVVLWQEMPMVPIPAGSFLMGSPATEKKRSSNEKQHRVQVASFLMGRYEVTVGDFRRFVNATGYQQTGQGCTWQGSGGSQTDQHPVTCVSWHGTQHYINWLNQKTGKTYRLPTEAEWEYAARAGTTTPFHTGACISTKQANFNGKAKYKYGSCAAGEYRGHTLAVGSLAKNRWGLYDMHGNVWEWTCSEYQKLYNGAESTCGNNTKSNAHRVLRGGSWFDGPRYARSALRGRFMPGDRSRRSGFRLMLGFAGQ